MVSCKKKGCTDPTATNYSSEAGKDDESCVYIPTIIINGVATMTVSVGDNYTDGGATATNKDGTAVNVTADISQINTDAVGSFIITYTATNENGTATTTRTVNVVIGQGNWLGSPTCSDDCSVTAFPLQNNPTVTAGASTTDIIISDMFTLDGGTLNCIIDGSTITVPSQTIPLALGDMILSGTGTMNVNGTQFTINYDYNNTTPLIGGTGSCTGTYDF